LVIKSCETEEPRDKQLQEATSLSGKRDKEPKTMIGGAQLELDPQKEGLFTRNRSQRGGVATAGAPSQ
jgi:hypothetical protein